MSGVANYYREKAGIYQAKIRNLQRGGASSVVCAKEGCPWDIAAVIIQKDGKRENNVYTGTVVNGVRYPNSHIKGEVSPLVKCLSAQKAACVCQELWALMKMVKCTYKLREDIACKAAKKGRLAMAHTACCIQLKFASTVCWGEGADEKFSIVMERRNHIVDGKSHGRLVCYAASVPADGESAQCLGNVQFLNKAGDDISMSVCSYLVGKPCTFLTARHGVATVATENVADTTALPPLDVPVPHSDIVMVTYAAPLEAFAIPQVSIADPLVQDASHPDVLPVPTAVMPPPIMDAPSVTSSRLDLGNVSTSDVPVDPQYIEYDGAIINGVIKGEKASIVVPLATVESDAVQMADITRAEGQARGEGQQGGYFGRSSQTGGVHHPSFGFSTYRS